jgi:hypothetical protein
VQPLPGIELVLAQLNGVELRLNESAQDGNLPKVVIRYIEEGPILEPDLGHGAVAELGHHQIGSRNQVG